MKKALSILFLFFAVTISAQIQAPTRFGAGLRLTNASEVTNFNTFEGIPLLRKSDGLVNNWIHSDSIVFQSQIKNLPLEWANYTGTRAGNNLFLNLGDFDNSGSGTQISLDDNSGILGILTPYQIRFKALEYQFRDFNNNVQSVMTFPTFTQTNNITWQDKSGSVAFLSDIPILQAGTNITVDNTDPLNPIINATGGGSTNLTYTPSPTNGTVVSSTGTDAVIPTVTTTNAGLQKPDFYDEGSWTPILTDNGGGATYSSLSGKYIRIGNKVYFNLYSDGINTNGTPTGYLYVSGVPFTMVLSNVTDSFSVGRFYGSNLTDSQVNKITSYSVPSLNRIFIGTKDSQSAVQNVTFTNGGLYISGIYITNVYTP